MRTHGAAVAAGYKTKVRPAQENVLLAAGALKTPAKNGYTTQGVNLVL